MARCSICYTIIGEDEPVTGCPACLLEYHAICWAEIGGCGTYGCERAAVTQKPPPPVLVGSGWGDDKPCPACGEQIGSSLLVCRCGARFPWADPMTTADYQRWRSEQEAVARARKVLTILFIASLLVVTSPVTGMIAGIHAFVRRRRLAGTGGTYLAMGYGSAALGGLAMILILLTALWP